MDAQVCHVMRQSPLTSTSKSHQQQQPQPIATYASAPIEISYGSSTLKLKPILGLEECSDKRDQTEVPFVPRGLRILRRCYNGN